MFNLRTRHYLQVYVDNNHFNQFLQLKMPNLQKTLFQPPSLQKNRVRYGKNFIQFLPSQHCFHSLSRPQSLPRSHFLSLLLLVAQSELLLAQSDFVC